MAAGPDDAVAAEAVHRLGYQAGAALLLWDIDTAGELARLHVERTRQLSALTMLPVALNTLAHILLLEGDLGAAQTSLAEAQPIIEATGSTLLSHGGALLAGWQGTADALGTLRDLVVRSGTEGNSFARISAQCASVIWFNGMRNYEQALALAIEADSEQWGWSAHALLPELVEAAVRSGQPTVAARTFERLSESTTASGTDWAIGVQRRSEALLREGTAAEDGYHDAIQRLRETKVRPQLARAHLLYGEWLRRERRKADARVQLRIASEMFTAMGIVAFAERTRRELLATGESVRTRDAHGFDGLTAQEANVARLAASGLTNPEIGAQLFISRRTVEFHLRKVFTKLDVTSRRQLRDALPEQHA